jgi:hypothetical protein
MKFFINICFAAIFLALNISIANSAESELSQCLLESTSAKDKRTLGKWAFVLLVSQSELDKITKINDKDKENSKQAALKIYNRLTFKDCKTEYDKAAVDNSESVDNAFSILGEAATAEIGSNSAVTEMYLGIFEFLDQEEIKPRDYI